MNCGSLMAYHCYTTKVGFWPYNIHFHQIIDKCIPVSIRYVNYGAKHSKLMFLLHPAKQTKIKKPRKVIRMLSKENKQKNSR